MDTKVHTSISVPVISRKLTSGRCPRGKLVRHEPLVKDPSDWLASEFDWDSNVTVVDMFSGAGGLSFGLDSVPGMSVVAAFEKDRWACETHRANMAAPVIEGDLSLIEDFRSVLMEAGVKRFDILAGGPPCQGFSKLGKGALRKLALSNRKEIGMEDERNLMFRHFMRAVKQLKPQVVLIENVPEMLRHRAIIGEIEEIFGELGYYFKPIQLHADDYGVPQTRRRLFMVANRTNDSYEAPAKRPRRRRTLQDAIGDLPPVSVTQLEELLEWHKPEKLSQYAKLMRAGLRRRSALSILDHVTRYHGAEDLAAFAHMKQGDLYSSVPEELRRYRNDIFIDKYHRMVWDEPSWTITAHISKDGYKYIHPEQDRTISVREAARIQSFPDRFKFTGSRTHRFTQIGNAVPPLLAEALGESLLPLVR